jgi:hypothetical protein
MSNDKIRKQFEQELGSKAIVENHKLEGEQAEITNQLREVLADCAADLQAKKIIHPAFQYLGSWSVHVYANELMRAFEFIDINNPHLATHPVADAALTKLKQSVNEHYTGKRQKLRSGF